MFGVCNLSIVPCRSEASDASELVTQLLFGDHFEVIEELGSWCKIIIAYDKYECWIDRKQFKQIEQHTFDLFNNSSTHYCNELIQIITNTNLNEIFPIVIGSVLPNYDNNECVIENVNFKYDGLHLPSNNPVNKEGILEMAMNYLNAPYLWGGKTPFGIDCSGFTQMVYKLCGIKLPRDASQQSQVGELLSFVEESEVGDLAFFDNEEGKIIHVGIIMENNKIIHASGKVRIDGFDHQGIFNKELNNYSHQLRLLKKVV